MYSYLMTDSDWGGSSGDQRSTLGGVNGGVKSAGDEEGSSTDPFGFPTDPFGFPTDPFGCGVPSSDGHALPFGDVEHSGSAVRMQSSPVSLM